MNKLYKRKKGYLLKEIAGDNILIARGDTALEVNGVFVFNEAGALLWDKLDQYMSIQDLAELLVSAYKIDLAQAIQDVRNCMKKMIEHNLIEVKEM